MTLEPAFPLAWPAGYSRTLAGLRRESAFRVTPAQAFDDLIAEANRFGSNVRVSMNAPRRKSDDKPYADALDDAVDDPGVVLYLTREGKRLCFPCDSYRTMRENIRGITIAVEAFRALERHGVKQLLSRAMESFVSLPPPSAAQAALRAPGARPWPEVLGVPSTATNDAINAAYRARARARELHDLGDQAQLQELNVARDEAMKAVAP